MCTVFSEVKNVFDVGDTKCQLQAMIVLLKSNLLPSGFNNSMKIRKTRHDLLQEHHEWSNMRRNERHRFRLHWPQTRAKDSKLREKGFHIRNHVDWRPGMTIHQVAASGTTLARKDQEDPRHGHSSTTCLLIWGMPRSKCVGVVSVIVIQVPHFRHRGRNVFKNAILLRSCATARGSS